MIRNILKKTLTPLRNWKARIEHSGFQRGYAELVKSTGVNADWIMAYASDEADTFQNAYALTSRVRDLLKTNTTYQKVRETLIANVFGSKGVMCLMDIREKADREVGSEAEKAALLIHERRINRLRAFGAKASKGRHEQYRAFKLADHLESERGRTEWGMIKKAILTVEGGEPSVYANTIIQDAWKEWQRPEFCDLRRRVSYKTHRHQRLMAAVRDGDCCIRMIRQPKSINQFGYTLQIINAEWLDRFYNATLDSGNIVRMGIEYKMTEWGIAEPVAYHFIKRTERDWLNGPRGSFNFSTKAASPMHMKVPAHEIFHYARCIDSDSTRPAPWVASTIAKARHLDQFLLYEVICAREACTKVGFLYSDMMPEGGMEVDRLPNPETVVDEGLSPGQTKGLPYGVKYQERNPSHPNTSAPEFRKLMLRDQCAGIPGVPYSVIAGDFEGINFSAGRLERLSYTDEWKQLQAFDTDQAEVPIFENFLEAFMLSGLSDLDPNNLLQYKRAACFISRRWAGVDEIKEVQAAALRVGNNISCLTDECAERGVNFEHIAVARAEERELLASYGLPTDPTLNGAPAQAQGPNAEQDVGMDATGEDGEELDDDNMNPETLKAFADAYGIGVRAGVLTPNLDDETAIRQKVGLPAPSEAVRKAWDGDGGSRKPITLQGQKSALKDSGLNEDGTTIAGAESNPDNRQPGGEPGGETGEGDMSANEGAGSEA